MQSTVIDWDGTNLPRELCELPPGRYNLVPLDEFEPLTPEEDADVQEGLDDLEAGRIAPFDEVLRGLRARLSQA